MKKEVLLADIDGNLSEVFCGQSLHHLLIRGYADKEGKNVCFEMKLGLKQAKLTYDDAVRFVDSFGGQLDEKMNLAELSDYVETVNARVLEWVEQGADIDFLLEDWYWSCTPSQKNYFFKIYLGNGYRMENFINYPYWARPVFQ